MPSDPVHGQAVAVRAQQPRYHALLVVRDLHAIDRVLITALQFAHGPVVIFLKHGQRLPRLLLEHERRERLHQCRRRLFTLARRFDAFDAHGFHFSFDVGLVCGVQGSHCSAAACSGSQAVPQLAHSNGMRPADYL